MTGNGPEFDGLDEACGSDGEALEEFEEFEELRLPRRTAVVLRVMGSAWAVATVVTALAVTAVAAAGFGYAVRGGPVWGVLLYALAGVVVLASVWTIGPMLVMQALSMAAAGDSPLPVSRGETPGEIDLEVEPTATSCLVAGGTLPVALAAVVIAVAVPGWLGPLDVWGRGLAEGLGLR